MVMIMTIIFDMVRGLACVPRVDVIPPNSIPFIPFHPVPSIPLQPKHSTCKVRSKLCGTLVHFCSLLPARHEKAKSESYVVVLILSNTPKVLPQSLPDRSPWRGHNSTNALTLPQISLRDSFRGRITRGVLSKWNHLIRQRYDLPDWLQTDYVFCLIPEKNIETCWSVICRGELETDSCLKAQNVSLPIRSQPDLLTRSFPLSTFDSRYEYD